MNRTNKSKSIQNYTLNAKPIGEIDIENIEIITFEDVPVVHEGDPDFNQCATNTMYKSQSNNKRKIADDIGDNDNGNKKSRAIRWRSEAIFNNIYFTLISKTEKGIEAKCMGCGKLLKGYATCTSNFITHLKNVNVIIVCQNLFNWII